MVVDLGDPFLSIRQGNFSQLREASNPLTVFVWNIDRGSEFSKIEETLRAAHADVCLLQEVDLHTSRTGFRDVAYDLARDLSMNFSYGSAFEELNQSTESQKAYQGQAILSRVPLEACRILRFQSQTAFWKPEPYLPTWFPQRRVGGRIALVSRVNVGNVAVIFYNLHLESRGPGFTRFAQLEETLRDCERNPLSQPVVIGGDLNTKYMASKFVDQLVSKGFRNCFTHAERTHRVIGDLDWIFVRGPITCEAASVNKSASGSDHFPLTAKLRISSPK